MRRDLARSVDPAQLLVAIPQKTAIACHAGAHVFHKSELADSVYYVQSGRLKIWRAAESGREAIIALATDGDFIGEGCLIGQPRRLANATCLADSKLFRIDKDAVLNLLRGDSVFAEDFMAYLLARNSRYQDDLEDQLTNSTEKRVARALLLLAHFGGTEEPLTEIPYTDPAILAQLVGTTRARVSQVMNKFRSKGLIEYDRTRTVVRPSLLNVLLKG